MNKLHQYLEQYLKDDLIYFAKTLGVGKISTLRKTELAKRVADFMLNSEIMKRRLAVLTDTQIALFEKAIQNPFVPREDELDDAYTINEMDYGIVTTNDMLFVPNDVKEVYNSINTPEFQESRKQTSWLLKCLGVHRAFYGIAPIATVYEMYQKRPKYKIGIKSMIELFYKIPQDHNDWFLVDEFIVYFKYHKEEALKDLMAMQRDKAFYIPTYREVDDYAKHMYLSEEPAYEQLRTFFVKNMRMPFEDAEDCTSEVWDTVSEGEGLGVIVNWLTEKRGLVLNSEQELRQLMNLLQNANNNTRMLVNRGFKPSELAGARENIARGILPTIVPGSSHAAELLKEALPDIKAMGFNVDIEGGATTIPVINYPNGINNEYVVSSKKIYPNDPCPCGSGKKYKKCCGRH